MNFLTQLLGGSLGNLFSGVSELISRFVADPQAKLAAQQHVADLEYAFRQELLRADENFVQQQAAVIQAEARSDSWLTRSWRPIVMLAFVFLIMWNYVVVPLFHGVPVTVPTDCWDVVKLGIGGYIGARSVEKVTAVVKK